jgi:hypothetical protein
MRKVALVAKLDRKMRLSARSSQELRIEVTCVQGAGESCKGARNGRSDRAIPTAAHVETRLPDNFFVGMLIRVETRQLACQHLPAHAASVKLNLECFHDANRHAANTRNHSF